MGLDQGLLEGGVSLHGSGLDALDRFEPGVLEIRGRRLHHVDRRGRRLRRRGRAHQGREGRRRFVRGSREVRDGRRSLHRDRRRTRGRRRHRHDLRSRRRHVGRHHNGTGQRRVGLAVVVTLHRHQHPLLARGSRGGRLVCLPQGAELQRHARGAELGERVEELREPVAALAVGGDGAVGATLEDPTDEPGQHRVGADLEEEIDAVGGHPLDHLHEAHRARDLPGEQVALGGRVDGVGLRRGVGVDGDPRGPEAHLVERPAERRRGALDHRRVERRGHVERLHLDALGREALGGARHRRRRPGDDQLLRRVVVGDAHVEAPLRQQRLEAGARARHRRHRAGGLRGRLAHGATALVGHPEDLVRADHAGGVQRHDLAEAVPRDRVGAEAEAREHPPGGQARGRQRRLRPLGRGEPRLLRARLDLAEGGPRHHHLGQGVLGVDGHRHRAVPHGLRLGEGDGELAAHVQPLGALPGEEHGHAARACGAGVVGAVGRLEVAVGGALGPQRRLLQLLSGIVGAVRDQEQPHRAGGVEALLRLAGNPRERARIGERRGGRAGLGDHLGGGGAGEREEVHGVVAQARRVLPGAGVLLQGDVEVAAAEAERADAGAARVIGAADPGASAGAQVERARRQVELGVRLADLDGGGDDAVVEGHHRLEHPGRAGGRLGVPDLRLDRAERAPLPVLAAGGVEDRAQPGELRRVAGDRSGAVRLDQLDGGGAVAGVLVGAAQGARLALGQGSVDALGLAVGGAAQAADHGVDAVAVALGVGQALEREHGQALAEHGAVSVLGEGPAVAGARERRGLAEADVHEHVVHGVDAAGDDHVGAPELEVGDGHGHRREGAGAGGVGDAVGPVQVEPVGDAAGDHVAEEPGEARLRPLGEALADALDDVVDLALLEAGVAHRLAPDRVLEPRRHGDGQLLRAGHAEHDADAIAGYVLEPGAREGVLEHLARHDEREELRGVGRGHQLGRDAGLGRIEVDRREEAATAGVGLVGRGGIGVVVVVHQPVARWHLAEQIGAADDVAPEAGLVGGAGEERAHADDGDGGAGELGFEHGTSWGAAPP